MKFKLTFFFITIISTGFGQINQTVDLKWKINENEKLKYSTVMSEINVSSADIDLNLLEGYLSDSTKNSIEKSKDWFKKYNEAFNKLDFIISLSKGEDGIVEIVMKSKSINNSSSSEIDTTETKKSKTINSINNKVVLRGSVYETGDIHSFWVKTSQKNLLAIFFQLPNKYVNIGDKWPIDVNLIENNQDFNCDSAYKLNEVKLTDIKNINGEVIAVLKYNIIEYVNGDFNSPSFAHNKDGKKKTMMKFSHQAIAQFSVTNGRWITYDGIMNINTSGVMNVNKTTKLTLIQGLIGSKEDEIKKTQRKRLSLSVNSKHGFKVNIKYDVNYNGNHDFEDEKDSLNNKIKNVINDSIHQYDMLDIWIDKRHEINILIKKIIKNELINKKTKIDNVFLVDVEIPKELEKMHDTISKLLTKLLESNELDDIWKAISKELKANKKLSKIERKLLKEHFQMFRNK